MRHFITITAALALCLLATTMQLHAKDDYDHTLTALWKSFYQARDNDRPKDEADILQKIKKEALAKGLAWDYYDACQEYVETRSRTNWKLYEKAQDDFRQEMERNAAPVALAFYRFNHQGGDGNDLGWLEKNKDRLLNEHNPEFYSREYSVSIQKFAEPLLDCLSNDYEFVLWALNSRRGGSDSNIADKAKSYFAGRYPLNAFADYLELDRKTGRKEAEGAFLSKYDGKAATLLVEEDRLTDRFSSLKNDRKSTQDDYKLLNAACSSFSKKRDACSGSEKAIAKCCTLPDQISKALNAQKVGFKIADGRLELYLRNVDEVSFSVRKEKESKANVFERKVKNPARSFYVADTVRIDLPVIDDGDYIVSCKAAGAEEAVNDWRKHSLSYAWRITGGGIAAYAADFQSGRPLDKADFVLTDHSGKTLAEARGLHLDGFTDLPADFINTIKKNPRGCNLQVSQRGTDGVLHSSFSQRVNFYGQSEWTPDESSLKCILMTDRSAFNPEETVHFKAILYSGYYKFKACGAGVAAKAELQDTKGKTLSTLDLKTDDFGSVDGEFFLPRTDNNGTYTVIIRLPDGDVIARRSIRVDDFVLPTFALVWADDSTEWHPGDTVSVKGNIKSYSGHNLGAADISFTVKKYGQEIKSGDLAVDNLGNFEIQFVSDKDDYWQDYQIMVKAVDATGETKEFSRSVYVRKDTKPEEPKEYFFKQLEGEPLALRVVAGSRTTWATAELFATGNILLEKRLVRFDSAKGAPADTFIRFDYKDTYPDVVSLKVLYFQNGRHYEHTITARRPDDSWKLPLRFTRFLDTTAPGAKYNFIIQTGTGVQCAATIFDKSTETIFSNRWSDVKPGVLPAPSVNYSESCGSDDTSWSWYDEWIGREYGRMVKNGRVLMKTKAMANGMVLAETSRAAAPAPDADSLIDTVEEAADEEAIPFQLAGEAPETGYIRENFANTIAWEPCLRSDKDGKISFTFTNADKLSTYYVQIFAHDRAMRNATLRREMVVTLPVKIAVVEPQILYDGDTYVMRATLSNSTAADVAGSVAIEFLDGSDYKTASTVASGLEKITVPASGSASVEKEIRINDVKDLGIKLTFAPDNEAQGADGVFVSIPVLPTVQTITEAHSSLFFPGDDRDALIERLRGQFVNFPGSEAAMREISILDMLKEAIPERVEPKSDNAVALTEALYAGMLADGLNGKPMKIEPESEILAKILKLQTPDGGFAWFEGMEPSPLVTCLVLERFHRMGLTQGTSEAVKYIDDIFFRREAQPYWRGWISLAQYLYIRSLYAGEDFSSKDIDGKFWKEFRKSAKAYLVPTKERGLNGAIFAKTRRVETLRNLLASTDGLGLASKWGIKLATGTRLENSLAKDIESLSQYAEPHKSGGMFFPNAVMPFRGLLESEAYAHSHLCRLMAETGHGDIADGVRLWLMVQKETQQWDTDPGYLEALHAVFEGSDQLLATKVIALKGSVTLPFDQVKAAGNGFTVEKQYFKDGKRIADGETLKVGDRITAVYKIWNEENRSFVKLTAPRNAALKPVDQLSGYHWGYYRNVLKDRTEYWYQSYPEEKTEVREEFYVQQAGVFQSAAVEIVCEYADHYRANDAGRPAMQITRLL